MPSPSRAKSPAELQEETADWPSVSELVAGRSVFITGGSGFMGKVLLEKLLYSGPGLDKLYVLMRTKRGKDVDTRLAEIFQLPLFHRVRSEQPGSMTKVVPIPGDLSTEDLALSPQHRELLQRECSMVFHFGASIRLNPPLKESIIQNTCATSSVLELVKGMHKLIAFVHLSTAFCHVDQPVLEETTYEPLHEPEDIMRAVKSLNDQQLAELERKVLPPHPNTYTFSKRLAETLVERASKDIPACIVRPSIVVPAWKEPLEGWVDNLNGPIGIMVAAGRGVLRSMQCKTEYNSEAMPVDLAINGTIGAAWRRACDKSDGILVYNVTQGTTNPITWGEVVSKGRKYVYIYPLKNIIWYPDGQLRSSRIVHEFYAFFYHLIPALIIDGLLFIFGQKRFMMKIYKRIKDGLNVLQYFSTREWKFNNTNFGNLKYMLKPNDNEVFFTDGTDIDQDSYLLNTWLGGRQYCLREDLASLPACRRHLRRLYWLQKLFNVLFYGFLVYLVLCYSETASYCVDRAWTAVKNFANPCKQELPGRTDI